VHQRRDSVRCARAHIAREADNGSCVDVREWISSPHFWLILDLYDSLHRRATFLQNVTDSLKPTSRCPSTLPLRHPSSRAAPHSRVTGETSCLHTFWKSFATGLTAPSSAAFTTISRHPPTSPNSSDARTPWKETDIRFRSCGSTHGHLHIRFGARLPRGS
jgi:hypothetical protein